MQQTPPPEWQAHTAHNFDQAMTAKSVAVAERIRRDAPYRTSLLTDPRPLHAELYRDFTPPNFGEYAGTYRGSPGTSLEGRRANAVSVLGAATIYEFLGPDKVAKSVESHCAVVREMLGAARNLDERLAVPAYQFAGFGAIHPFLDGNGHVQRALLLASACELNLKVSDRWTIHPRPYDRLFALALEMFTRAPANEPLKNLDLVSQYVELFLTDGA